MEDSCAVGLVEVFLGFRLAHAHPLLQFLDDVREVVAIRRREELEQTLDDLLLQSLATFDRLRRCWRCVADFLRTAPTFDGEYLEIPVIDILATGLQLLD